MLGKLFVISASSGVGKTSLVLALVAKLEPHYSISRLITYTTRRPRSSDIHGQDYHFITEQEFLEKIEQGFFIEWSTAYGAYYGSPKHILEELETGKSTVAILDFDGATAIKQWHSQSILIWLYPPTHEIIKERLISRDEDTPEEIAFRMTLAEKEALLDVVVRETFNHRLINDNFEKTLNELEELLIHELQQ